MNKLKDYLTRKQGKYISIFSNLLISLLVITTKAEAKDNVLVIHSYHASYSWTDNLVQGINEGFSQKSPDVAIFHEFLDTKRYPHLQYDQSLLTYINDKYQNTNIDVLMVSDDPGLELILRVRDEYFPNIPVVFLGINHISKKILNTPGITGVFENRDVAETIWMAKQQTNSEHLIVINDSTETGIANLQKIQEIQKDPRSPKKIEIINDLIPKNIAEKLGIFSEKIPILLIGQLRKDTNNSALYKFESSIEILKSKINNPIYAVTVEVIDRGIVGGKFLEGKRHAKQAVALAVNILQGDDIQNIKPILKAENHWLFDAEELKKFDIDINSIPENSEIINIETSFYQKYQGLVWLTTIAFLTTVFIIILLLEIIRRGVIHKNLLQENKLRYKDFAQAGANIFWEIDTNLKFSYISGDTEYLYSKNSQEILGKTLCELFVNNSNFDFPWNRYEKIIREQNIFDNFIFSLKQDNKEVKIFQLNGKPIYNQDQKFIGYRGIKREITQEYNLSQTIAYQATYDSLTGLINRREFNNKLKELVKDNQNSNNKSVLCFLDLDRFKLVNDTAGHLVGDTLLAELANLLKTCIRKQDILGRLGGDEFGLLLINTSSSEAKIICQNIINQIDNYRFQWNNRQFNIGISIGLISIDSEMDATELLSKADLACYKAKDWGRGRLYIADNQEKELHQHQMQMEYIANVSQAIEQDQFYLVKQRIKAIAPKDSKYEHYEILLRYHDENGNIISPALFIPVAEKYGVISIIDRWVLEKIVNNYHLYFPNQNTMVSINLSGISISNEEFTRQAINFIKNSNIDPTNICFEITETAAISQMSRAKEFIDSMKKLGIKFALDDFGSGVSSFGYLKNLPVDYLKIDGSLIKNILTESSDRAIVNAIKCIAQIMGMKTIAEFVENDEILEVLAEIDIDYAQGYGIGKPVSLISMSQAPSNT